MSSNQPASSLSTDTEDPGSHSVSTSTSDSQSHIDPSLSTPSIGFTDAQMGPSSEYSTMPLDALSFLFPLNSSSPLHFNPRTLSKNRPTEIYPTFDDLLEIHRHSIGKLPINSSPSPSNSPYSSSSQPAIRRSKLKEFSEFYRSRFIDNSLMTERLKILLQEPSDSSSLSALNKQWSLYLKKLSALTVQLKNVDDISEALSHIQNSCITIIFDTLFLVTHIFYRRQTKIVAPRKFLLFLPFLSTHFNIILI
jgi:hypothetical protein